MYSTPHLTSYPYPSFTQMDSHVVQMEDAFAEAIVLFDDKISKYELPATGGALEKSFSDLDWFPRSYWQMRNATAKTEEMLEGLQALSSLFSDIWPWSLCYHAQTALREVTDNAVYTWEQELLKKDGKVDSETMNKIKNTTIEKFRADAATATAEFSSKVCARGWSRMSGCNLLLFTIQHFLIDYQVMKLILLPPFEAVLQPAAKHIVDPLANMIPEPLQEFIDINQDFEDLYNGILDDSIANVVGHRSKHHSKDSKHSKDKEARISATITITSTTTTATSDEGEQPTSSGHDGAPAEHDDGASASIAEPLPTPAEELM